MLWISEDDKLQGLTVAQSNVTSSLKYDVVFVVDNSASMGEEANAVANEIVDFVNFLARNGVAARVGVVGVAGKINGAVDLSDSLTVDAFLNRTNVTGTRRTVGFYGTNAAQLTAQATNSNAGFGGGENGIHGILYAEAAFSFTSGSQRVFVNITDEPSQPQNQPANNSATLCARWQPTTGTIHTVWSGAAALLLPDGNLTTTGWTENSGENPAAITKCTGGTVTTVQGNASDLDLIALNFSKVIAGAALVQFESANADAPHNVAIMVKNGSTADGQTVYLNQTYPPILGSP